MTENYLKICREIDGRSQAEVADIVGVDVRTMSKYENSGRVPDDIIAALAELYNAPLLAIWHLKNNNPLGKYLPDIFPTQTDGDLGFQTVLAAESATSAKESIIAALKDGFLSIDSLPLLDAYITQTDAATGKFVSAKAYAIKARNDLTRSVSAQT